MQGPRPAGIRIAAFCCLLAAGCNPFAPAYDPEGLANVNLLGDPSSIEGYFQLFKNAYELRDTTPTEAVITRNFNLSVAQDEQTVFSGSGRARMRLRRANPGEAWRAYYWFDDSDF